MHECFRYEVGPLPQDLQYSNLSKEEKKAIEDTTEKAYLYTMLKQADVDQIEWAHLATAMQEVGEVTADDIKLFAGEQYKDAVQIATPEKMEEYGNLARMDQIYNVQHREESISQDKIDKAVKDMVTSINIIAEKYNPEIAKETLQRCSDSIGNDMQNNTQSMSFEINDILNNHQFTNEAGENVVDYEGIKQDIAKDTPYTNQYRMNQSIYEAQVKAFSAAELKLGILNEPTPPTLERIQELAQENADYALRVATFDDSTLRNVFEVNQNDIAAWAVENISDNHSTNESRSEQSIAKEQSQEKDEQDLGQERTYGEDYSME